MAATLLEVRDFDWCHPAALLTLCVLFVSLPFSVML
jgi:hypothetical protein